MMVNHSSSVQSSPHLPSAKSKQNLNRSTDMSVSNKFILLALSLVLTVAALNGCSRYQAGNDPASTATGSDKLDSGDGSSSDGIPTPCLKEADIANAVGFQVRVIRETTRSVGEHVSCNYQVTDDKATKLGAFVAINVAPASKGNEFLERVRSGAQTIAGKQAEAIDVGERGYAYGGNSMSEAAAIAGGRVYHVGMSSLERSIGDKKDALILILKKVIG